MLVETQEELPPGSDLIIGDSTLNERAVEIHNIVHGTDCSVYVERDSDGDGVVEESILVDDFVGAGISQGNELEIIRPANMRFRLRNTGTGAADFIVTGQLLE